MRIALCAMHPFRDDVELRWSESLALANLQSFLTRDQELYSRLTVYRNTYCLGNISLQAIRRDIVEQNPDLIGFSCYSWNAPEVIALAQCLRPELPRTMLVLGGPAASDPRVADILRHGLFDVIVKGEGEVTFFELVEAQARSGRDLAEIAGLLLRSKGRVVATPGRPQMESLDDIPSPLLNGILDPTDKAVVLWEIGRGCPYRCSYCFDNRRSTASVRYVSMPRIQQELDLLAASGVQAVDIVDSTFNLHRDRCHRLLELLLEHGKRFRAIITARGDLLDERTATLMASGRLTVFFGLQSTSFQVNKATRRTQNLGRFATNLLRLHTLNKQCEFVIDLIYGLPLDDYDGFKRSVDKAFDLNPDRICCQALQIQPGTTIMDDIGEFGLKFANRDLLEQARSSMSEHRTELQIVLENSTYSAEDMALSRDLTRALELLVRVPLLFGLFPHLVRETDTAPSRFIEDWLWWLKETTGTSVDELCAAKSSSFFMLCLRDFLADRLRASGKEALASAYEDLLIWLEVNARTHHVPPVSGHDVMDSEAKGPLRLSHGVQLLSVQHRLNHILKARNLHERREAVRRVPRGDTHYLLYRNDQGVRWLDLPARVFRFFRLLSAAAPSGARAATLCAGGNGELPPWVEHGLSHGYLTYSTANH